MERSFKNNKLSWHTISGVGGASRVVLIVGSGVGWGASAVGGTKANTPETPGSGCSLIVQADKRKIMRIKIVILVFISVYFKKRPV
jgi:hypothetical protein